MFFFLRKHVEQSRELSNKNPFNLFLDIDFEKYFLIKEYDGFFYHSCSHFLKINKIFFVEDESFVFDAFYLFFSCIIDWLDRQQTFLFSAGQLNQEFQSLSPPLLEILIDIVSDYKFIIKTSYDIDEKIDEKEISKEINIFFEYNKKKKLLQSIFHSETLLETENFNYQNYLLWKESSRKDLEKKLFVIISFASLQFADGFLHRKIRCIEWIISLMSMSKFQILFLKQEIFWKKMYKIEKLFKKHNNNYVLKEILRIKLKDIAHNFYKGI